MWEYNCDGDVYRVSNSSKHWKGPVLVEINGTVHFSRNTVYLHHKASGPAEVKATGKISYREYGRLHRTNGPAIIHADGKKEYWINGNSLSPMEYLMIFNKV